jgi:integrase
VSAPESVAAWPAGVCVPGVGDRVYDRRAVLSASELAALTVLAGHRTRWPNEVREALTRLTVPIDDVLRLVAPGTSWPRWPARGALMLAMQREREAFWGWDRETWVDVLHRADHNVRQHVMAVAYLLCGWRDLHVEFHGFKCGVLARRVFGAGTVGEQVARVQEHLDGLGYAATLGRPPLLCALFDLMLGAGSPRLEDLALDPGAFVALDARARPAVRHGISQLAGALVAIGVLERSPLAATASDAVWLARTSGSTRDVPARWADWVSRWFQTSTLTRRTRVSYHYTLLKCGRWLAEQHPAAADPGVWTRALAGEWVAAVDRMLVGEYSHAPNTDYFRARSGGPLSARSKEQHITAVRVFFRDLQEWEWIERGFDTHRVLSVPRSIRALIGPDPRVIADEVWAKLLWAGLNLTEQDLPVHPSGARWYPIELVRAVGLLWLFGGLRVDEILRLRLGAIRWQPEHTAGAKAAAVCLLDVPTNKTGTAFTKPVDRTVGDAIDAWEAVRPEQPWFVDPKTSEAVQMLFAYRGARLGAKYLNRVLIPLLCKKAGVPTSDMRGQITSHRGRATIASQLYNAKDPMSLFELQAWLGHRSPQSTQHYARITPTTLTKAYTDAGYFARNVRAIEVLLDRDAIQTGAAANGQPFEFYDLGHGYCTYSFFEQCPHRMACARCDFYVPKHSSGEQLLEANTSLQRMLVQIPLTDDERAAVEDDQNAVGRLIDLLADVPTPAGPTPHELKSAAGPELPLPHVNVAQPSRSGQDADR